MFLIIIKMIQKNLNYIYPVNSNLNYPDNEKDY